MSDALLNLIPDDVNLDGKVINPSTALANAIQAVSERMVDEYPQLPRDMEKIRACIRSAPELKATLTPEQIGIIMKGFQAVTDIAIVPAKVKKTKAAKLDLDSDEPDEPKPAPKAKPVTAPVVVSSAVASMLQRKRTKAP